MGILINEKDEQLLFDKKYYDAFQFLLNAEKNLQTAQYCAEFIEKINSYLQQKQLERQERIQKIVKEKGIYEGSIKEFDTSIEILGEKIDSHFLKNKYVKDFMQYSRNTFDSLAQFINVTYLYENSMDLERVDFIKICGKLSGECLVCTVAEEIKQSEQFKYISEFNNKTKHISDVDMSISFDILSPTIESKIHHFEKRGKSFCKRNVDELLVELFNFQKEKLANLVEGVREWISSNEAKRKRFHTVSFEAQLIEGAPDNYFCIVYIEENNIEKSTDEIEVLFVKKDHHTGIFESMNFPYDEVFIKNNENLYMGKFTALEKYKSSSDIKKYRNFKKQKFHPATPYVRNENITPWNSKYYVGYMSGEIKQAKLND